eukprot:2415659-Amphidinium_carterae.1
MGLLGESCRRQPWASARAWSNARTERNKQARAGTRSDVQAPDVLCESRLSRLKRENPNFFAIALPEYRQVVFL